MKYLVYAEMRVSYAVHVDAKTWEEAERLGLDEMPGANLQDVDSASEWHVLSITGPDGAECLPGQAQ